MSFERGKDPKETMEIGRQKDAISVLGVKYYTNGQEVSITDPEIIRIFLEQFSTYQLPYNPIFGPQRIILISTEKYLDTTLSVMSRLFQNPNINSNSHSQIEPIERERSIDLNILDYAEKTVIFNNKMFEMPSLEKLEEKGFGYFEKCERNYLGELQITLEAEKAKMHEEMKAMKAIVNSKYGSLGRMDKDFRLPTSILGITKEEEDQNKKEMQKEFQKEVKKIKGDLKNQSKKWFFDIETFR